jgi:hypothetical protein
MYIVVSHRRRYDLVQAHGVTVLAKAIINNVTDSLKGHSQPSQNAAHFQTIERVRPFLFHKRNIEVRACKLLTTEKVGSC